MSFMIIPVIVLCVSFGIAIPSAFRHDADLPISVTGKAKK